MLTQILLSSLQILTSFYLTIVLLRFLLQLARADFYNPITQFVVRATNPLLVPLRRVIPGWGGIDGASLVLAILVQSLVFVLMLLATDQGFAIDILMLLTWSVVYVLWLIVKIYFWSLIAVIILSWIAPANPHPAIQLLMQITEPVMKPFRKILPPMGGLDLSPILVFLVLNAVSLLVNHLVIQVGLGKFVGF